MYIILPFSHEKVIPAILAATGCYVFISVVLLLYAKQVSQHILFWGDKKTCNYCMVSGKLMLWCHQKTYKN